MLVVTDGELLDDSEAEDDRLLSLDRDGTDVDVLLTDIDPLEVCVITEVLEVLALGLIVFEEVTEVETLEEAVELFDVVIENVNLKLADDDTDIEAVDDPKIDELPELLALSDGELLELTLPLEVVDTEELYVSLGVKLLVAEELLDTVSLGGGGVGSAECVLIADGDLVTPKLLDELVEEVEDLDTEILLVPVELTDLVLLVVTLDVDDPDKDDVLLDEIDEVIVEEDEDVFELNEDTEPDLVDETDPVDVIVPVELIEFLTVLLSLLVNELFAREDGDLEDDT